MRAQSFHRIVNLSNALSFFGAGGGLLHTCHILIVSSFGQTVNMLSPDGPKQAWVISFPCALGRVINLLQEGYSCTVIELVSAVGT